MAEKSMVIQLPEELAERYEALAAATGEPVRFFMVEALGSSIDELERVQREFERSVLEDIEDYRAGKLETVSLEEMSRDLGLEE